MGAEADLGMHMVTAEFDKWVYNPPEFGSGLPGICLKAFYSGF